MKNLFNIKKLLLIAMIAITSVSCNDDDTPTTTPPVDNTITGIASRTPDLSTLYEALSRVGLDETLQTAGPFTVFAPTNDAFSDFLADNNLNSLDDVSDEVLTQILLNHVVSGSFQSSNLSTGYIKTLATTTASGTNTMSMYVDLTSGVKLNGVSSVTTPNVIASNGVVHIVNAVIGLPTIVTHAAANPSFSTLVSVVTNPAQSAILNALSGPGPLTVFAPTNAGFLQLNTDLVNLGIPGGIAGVDDAIITNVLLYHVLAGNNLASSLTSTDYNTLLGQTFEVQLTGGPKIIDNNDRTANIIITDVQCSNGVIHAIDNAILPSL
jgi:uncharacterized surface protein with fasciclin (FAS1) repeats